jgi:hypothetical protein
MIPQCLSELLLRFDTVVLPGLGAFSLKNIPASIKGNEISPPGKILLFDSSVKNNDGVLANYISEKDKISFFDACSRILEYVENIWNDLNNGNEVMLEKIGLLKRNTSGTINFIADTGINYNIDSFGLTSITAIPLTESQKEIKAKENIPDKKKKFPSVAIWIIAAFVIFASGITAAYFIKPDLFSRIGINIGPEKINNSLTPNDSTINGNQSDSIRNSQSEKQGNVSYYIIAASFRIKENADNYVISLSNRGHKPESFFMPEKGLYVVSYDAYDDKEKAEQVLSKIKENENAAAWILEK